MHLAFRAARGKGEEGVGLVQSSTDQPPLMGRVRSSSSLPPLPPGHTPPTATASVHGRCVFCLMNNAASRMSSSLHAWVGLQVWTVTGIKSGRTVVMTKLILLFVSFLRSSLRFPRHTSPPLCLSVSVCGM